VGIGGAVTGEVLGAGAQARLGQPRGEGAGVVGDTVGIVAEGAGADDGVGRIGGHIQHRGQVQVDVAGGQDRAERMAGVAGQLGVVGLPERPGGGEGGAGGGLEPSDVPPSSSIATRQSSARAWTARSSPWAVTTSGVLWPNRITEARPASSTSPSHGGSVVPVKGAISTPSASASQEVGCMPQPCPGPAG